MSGGQFVLGGLAFAATLALIPLVTRVAVLSNVTAAPRDDRLHTNPTPYLGGVAIVLVAFAVSPFLDQWEAEAVVILAGALLLGVVGLLDDIRNLPPAPRLIAEVIAALMAAAVGAKVDLFGGAIDIALTVLWLVAVTNAFNIVDNMDGAAGGIAAASAVGLAVAAGMQEQVLVGGMAAVTAGACLGFLVHNWYPAKIFMGDAGTLPLGYLLAAIALKLRFPAPHASSIAAIVLFTAPALFDMTLVVISRTARGKPVYQGGVDHTSHRLLRLGWSTHLVAGLITATAAATATLGVLVGREVVPALPVVVPGLAVGVALLVLLLRLPAEPTLAPTNDATAHHN